jgi:hypothetical protein
VCVCVYVCELKGEPKGIIDLNNCKEVFSTETNEIEQRFEFKIVSSRKNPIPSTKHNSKNSFYNYNYIEWKRFLLSF